MVAYSLIQQLMLILKIQVRGDDGLDHGGNLPNAEKLLDLAI